MKLLLLTYPLTAVSPSACGGTEQMAYLLLQSLTAQPNVEITWVGAPGSRPRKGIHFIPWPRLLTQYGLPGLPLTPIPQTDLDALWARCGAAARRLAAHLNCSGRLDIVHNLGGLFEVAADDFPAPVLFTRHLARALYPAEKVSQPPLGVHWQCVSRSQQAEYGPTACCGVIANGIDLRRFLPRTRAPGGAAPLLYLGRICPEKAPHAAIAMARATRRRLWLVGTVAPFPSHRQYFEASIAPQLNGDVRWLPPPLPAVKRDLLAAAAAVVIPSCIAETSSIVAMEAAACGVPVLAARIGALPEVVADGQTGFVGDDAYLTSAVARLHKIAPQPCRHRAEQYFDATRMTSEYLHLYRRLSSHPEHFPVPHFPPSVPTPKPWLTPNP